MAPFDVEPDKPIEEILRAIREGALEGAHSQSRTSAYAIGPFSALLVRLSRDAEKTARTVRRLTWAIVALTVMLLVLTGVLVWLTWVLVEEDSPGDSDEPTSRTTGLYGQTHSYRSWWGDDLGHILLNGTFREQLPFPTSVWTGDF